MKITLDTIPHIDKPINKQYPYLTKLVFMDKSSKICIINNVHPKFFSAYVFDNNEEEFNQDLFKHVDRWYKRGAKIPLSLFFEKNNLKPYVEEISKIIYFKTIAQIEGFVYNYPSYENITHKLFLHGKKYD